MITWLRQWLCSEHEWRGVTWITPEGWDFMCRKCKKYKRDERMLVWNDLPGYQQQRKTVSMK